MSASLNLSDEQSNGKEIIRLEGRLDASTAPLLETKMNEMEAAGKNLFLLDFSKVDYLSSAGMRLLLSSTKKAKAKGGKVAFCSMSDEVMEIIKMAGFERILSIYKNETEALASF